jgi:hypothetical protein
MRGQRRRRRERIDRESAPRREPMSRGRGHKGLSEYFAPLVRFLRSRVGEPWDEVYSEIRRCVPNDSTVREHVYVHLDEFVLRNVFLEDGKRMLIRWGERQELAAQQFWGDTFFVCPKTGLLRELPSRRRRSGCVRKRDVRIAGPDTQMHRIDGLWFEIRLADVPADAAGRRRAFDRVLRKRVCDLDAERRYLTYGTARRYGVARRALSRREIRAAKQLPCVRLHRDRYDRWDLR